MLSAVASALSRQLRMDEESLEFFLCDNIVETLAPATHSLTQKDRFAARVPQHQPPSLALPAAEGAMESWTAAVRAACGFSSACSRWASAEG